MPSAFHATAMILAAGRGERMKPLTDNKPKPLLEVNGRALICYHLEKLSQQGVTQVVINVAWLGQLIKQALGEGSDFGLSIHYCDEGDLALETAGGIINALPYLAEEFWVINADVYTEFDFTVPDLASSKAHLILVENPSFHPQGDFGIEEGLLLNEAFKTYTFSGIGYYKKSFFNHLDTGKRPLAPLIRRFADVKKITAQLYQGSWSDVGTPQRLKDIQQTK